jgi:hypothetical protein
MMAIRWLRILAVLLAGVAVTVFQPVSARADEAEPVGFWESVETSQGGIGAALELTEDGRVRLSAVVLVESAYRLDGDHLVLTDPAGGEQEIPITFGHGTMTMTGPDGSKLEKTRLQDPSAGSSPILGDWFYDYFGQGTAYERYTEDGKMLFRLPLRIDAGTYRLQGGRMKVEVAGQKKKWTWRLDGGELVIGPRGKESRYRRVPDGAWYLK